MPETHLFIGGCDACRDGQATEIVRRESYEDLVRNDLIPEGLAR